MKKKLIYDSFIEVLREKYPRRAELTNVLMETLDIEREAVYRRLRGTVPFSFAEIAIISRQCGISLDGLIGTMITGDIPCRMKLIEHLGYSDNELQAFAHLIELFRDGNQSGNSKLFISCNTHPKIIFFQFPLLARFYFFKWAYLYNHIDTVKSYEEIRISGEQQYLMDKFLTEIKNVEETCIVYDYDTMEYLINDIQYFATIRLIEPDSVKELKEEIFHMIDECQQLTTAGRYRNGNPVDFYVTHINLNSSYSYFESEGVKVSLLQAMTISSIMSLDELAYDRMKRWIQSLIRMSCRISGNNERERNRFLENQRQMAARL